MQLCFVEFKYRIDGTILERRNQAREIDKPLFLLLKAEGYTIIGEGSGPILAGNDMDIDGEGDDGIPPNIFSLILGASDVYTPATSACLSRALPRPSRPACASCATHQGVFDGVVCGTSCGG